MTFQVIPAQKCPRSFSGTAQEQTQLDIINDCEA
jgi:hypothetical protein